MSVFYGMDIPSYGNLQKPPENQVLLNDEGACAVP